MRMYWSDVKVKAIFGAFINGSDTQKVVEMGIRSPEEMAVDWLAQNIYWVDTAASKIEVARLDGSSRRTLIWEGLNEPRSIALNPAEGYMYWSEWENANCIKRASLDGSNQTVIISNTEQARCLTLDYDDKLLCWIEFVATPTIQCSNLEGQSRKIVIFSGLHKPMGLTLYKDTIYWTDWKTGEVYAAKKSTGFNRTTIHTRLNGVTDLVVVHSSRSNQWNQCSAGNGGCSNLCLALPAGVQGNSMSYRCACPTHYILQNNTCTRKLIFPCDHFK